MSDPGRTQRRWSAAWPWLLLAAALTLWTFAGPSGDPLTLDTPAPALSLTTTTGEFDLAGERGRVVVLAFWATWCSACRTEAPILSRVHERIGREGDRVVGVSIDQMPLGDLGGAARQLGMSYPVAMASRTDFDRFQVELLPTIYVIGPEGRIRATFAGPASESALVQAVEGARDARISQN